MEQHQEYIVCKKNYSENCMLALCTATSEEGWAVGVSRSCVNQTFLHPTLLVKIDVLGFYLFIYLFLEWTKTAVELLDKLVTPGRE